jgi:hypothetical protein
MQQKKALHAATREGSLSGSTGQGEERALTAGNRVGCNPGDSIERSVSYIGRKAETRTFKATQGRKQV